MKLKELFSAIIKEGIAADPRGEQHIRSLLKEKKDEYDKLNKEEKGYFDKNSLENPYADSKLLNGQPNQDIQCALVGVDIDVGELMLATWLNEKKKGKKIDACISHHPQGYALAGFYEVMGMQANILSQFGVPINIGEGLLKTRMAEVERRVHAANHNRSVDAARLLEMPLICMHTPADNHAAQYIQNFMNKKKPRRIGDILEILESIPEYQHAMLNKGGPKVLLGDKKREAGKILVEMTGGTEGSGTRCEAH